MNDTKSQFILWLFSLVPYTLVAWAYAAFTDSGSSGFWKGFGVLAVARMFFAIIETLGSVLAWRAYQKRVMVRKFLEVLRAEKFPKRVYRRPGFLPRFRGARYRPSSDVRRLLLYGRFRLLPVLQLAPASARSRPIGHSYCSRLVMTNA